MKNDKKVNSIFLLFLLYFYFIDELLEIDSKEIYFDFPVFLQISSKLNSPSSVAWILCCTPTNSWIKFSFTDAYFILFCAFPESGTHATKTILWLKSTIPYRGCPIYYYLLFIIFMYLYCFVLCVFTQIRIFANSQMLLNKKCIGMMNKNYIAWNSGNSQIRSICY